VDVDTTADGRGSLTLSSAGQFYARGTAKAWPNPIGSSGRMVAVALTADGQGAVAMSEAGQFYAYGTARPQPNPTGFSGRMVDVSLTADGQGLVAMSSAGQLYAYGTARPQPNPTGFSGEMRAVDLTADGQGLMSVSSAGQFYAYGTARPQPNPTGFTGSIVDVDITADGQGALAASSSGQAYHYGSVRPLGNADPGTVDTVTRLQRPAEGRITSPFGMRLNPVTGVYALHAGIDIGAPRGAAVVAAESGRVVESRWVSRYGNLIRIAHANGLETRYAHLSGFKVALNQQVARGQLIGLVGSTGNSTGPHLHFETRVAGQPVNPMQYL
jgi:murein DD-endopeptidase MepM/ murein hydrolase activator NlpD